MKLVDLDSSAIESLTIDDDLIAIQYKSSDKSYYFKFVDEKIVDYIIITIRKQESLGKLIANLVKSGQLESINTDNK